VATHLETRDLGCLVEEDFLEAKASPAVSQTLTLLLKAPLVEDLDPSQAPHLEEPQEAVVLNLLVCPVAIQDLAPLLVEAKVVLQEALAVLELHPVDTLLQVEAQALSEVPLVLLPEQHQVVTVPQEAAAPLRDMVHPVVGDGLEGGTDQINLEVTSSL